MSRKFWPVLIAFVFIFTLVSGSAGLLQAQSEKPATPDKEPREISDQEVHVEPPPAEAAVGSPRAAILNEGFEGNWPAGLWTLVDFSSADGGEYLWDDSNCWPHTGQWAAYSVGGGADGNQLPCWGPYPNNTDTWALYGPFNLGNASAASVTFYFTGSTEGGNGCPFDRFFVGHSANGSDFQGTYFCGDWTGGPDGNQYNRRTLDLAPRLGDSSVWIGLTLQSDDSQNDIGMMVDDIRIDVTASCATPVAPGLVAPANGSTTNDTTPAFSWNSVANANEYEIQVDNNSNFSSPVIDQTRTVTNFTPGTALAPGTYYWHVGGNNTAGGCNQLGPWSATWSFTVSGTATCYPLTLDHTGSGGNPTASPTASAGCAAGRYTAGQTINLTASPANGWRVSGWQGTNNNGSTAINNTATMPASAHTVRANYTQFTANHRSFLPSQIYGLSGFLGPFEIEPNNSTGEANGPILLNRNYQGFPNDLSDYYYFDLAAPAQIGVTLTGITGTDPQLHLYYNSSASRVGYDPTPPYNIVYAAQPGRYWVRVVVVGNYNTSNAYTVRVSNPASD